MSDDETFEDDDIPTKSGGPSSLLLIVNLLVGAVGVGGVGYLVFTGGSANAEAEEAGPAVVHKVEPFIVNLNEAESSRYLKVALEIEVKNKAVADELTERDRVTRHALLEYLSSLSVADTMGKENRERIRAAIHGIFQAEVGEGDAMAVYITDFVVQ